MKTNSIASLLGVPAIAAAPAGPGLTVHHLQDDDELPADPPITETTPKRITPMKHNEPHAQQVLDAITAAHPDMLSRAQLLSATGLETAQLSSAMFLLKKSGRVRTTGATVNIRYGLAGKGSEASSAESKPAKSVKRAKPPKREKIKTGKAVARRAKAARVTPEQTVSHPLASAPADGERRFGFYSDGVLEIDCPSCKGRLTQDDIAAMSAFVKTFEQRGRGRHV